MEGLEQFKQLYIEDAKDLLIGLEKDLLQLDKDPKNEELIDQVFRVMHTFKGTSSMYGYDHIGKFTHNLESIYQSVKDEELEITFDIIDFTLISADHIKNLLNDENLEKTSNQTTHNKLNQRLNGILNNAKNKTTSNPSIQNKLKKSKSGFNTYHIIIKINPNFIVRNIKLINILKDLFNLGDYSISSQNFLENNDIEYATIYIATEHPLERIEEEVMFIRDDCQISKITDYNIFDKEAVKTRTELFDNPNMESDKPEAEKDSSFELFTEDESDGIEKQIETVDVLQTDTNRRISVDSEKLDKLMFLVSELITTNSQFVLAAKNKLYKPLRQNIEKLNKLSNEFRNNALNIRLIPIKDITIKFDRLIRDLSKSLGKEVEFVTEGVNTELDKNTIDVIAEPIMHIIRNCLDHGIEKSEERIKVGKAPKGLIKLTAYHSGTNIFIEIQDDGKGIDTEHIKRKAIEKGLISENNNISEKELYDLIFLPGFSTAQNLTQVSGRGVGMDIVKKRITEIRGEVEIESKKGQGTSFSIKLHQTISIMDTLLVQVADSYFILPVSDVQVCNQIIYSEIEQKQNTTKCLTYAHELIPFVNLRKEFNLTNNPPEKSKTILVTKNNTKFALIADKIIGEHQAVLKPLGNTFKNQELISAASTLGDGNLAFMLDLNSIYKTIN